MPHRGSDGLGHCRRTAQDRRRPLRPAFAKPLCSRLFLIGNSETPTSAWTPGLPISPPACNTRPATRFHPAWMQQSCAYPKSIRAVHPDNSPQRDCAYGTATILPLSTNPDEIKERIEKLSPVGSLTYSALGLLWGQRLLMPSWKSAWGGSGAHPLDPSAGEDEVRKAIVLLTDGEDTYCGRGKHDCKDSPVGIWRAEACDEAKSRGTEIFVVAAMDPKNISNPVRQSSRAVLQPEGC